MAPSAYSCPMPRAKVIDTYFVEHRAKLLDLAAFIDRVERSDPKGQADRDYRLEALRKALAVVADEKPERARRVLELLSDPTPDPIAKSPGKGASGAWPGRR